MMRLATLATSVGGCCHGYTSNVRAGLCFTRVVVVVSQATPNSALLPQLTASNPQVTKDEEIEGPGWDIATHPPHLAHIPLIYSEKFESKYIQDYLGYNDIHLQNISTTTQQISEFIIIN